MGVPAFFRWLSRKFPKIITPVIEEEGRYVDGTFIPASYADQNPNGELDNLYLDMNGIVHPCSHPDDKPAPETEEEMLLAIFEYTDRVLNMARPRKVLMIAVDGVAPRAKMNQQRARRFKSAKDKKIQDEEKERISREMGEIIDDSIKSQKTWDSNAITPGTPFMNKLAEGLRYWTSYKLATDPGWANLQIIISDATVPGEGEHKIMNFIRSQRSDSHYDPNTKHAIYGLDADLIFLGLATHEPHFRVLREDVFAQDSKTLPLKYQINMTEDEKKALREVKKPFLWLNINVLREYLEVELNIPRLSFKFDLERAIDDWVFMCFFCGNDFLPHLPSLDVRDNSIDTLVGIWKRILPRLSSYLTTDGTLNLENVEVLLAQLGSKEPEIFKKRYEQEQQRENKRKRFQKPVAENHSANILFDTSGNSVNGTKITNSDFVKVKTQTFEEKSKTAEEKQEIISSANEANVSAAASLRQKLLASKNTGDSEASSVNDSESNTDQEPTVPAKRRAEDEAIDLLDADPIKFQEPGYNSRYYRVKLHVEQSDVPETRKSLVHHYIEGISWVLLYYYQGCPSWNWYYPYHYAPFAADFTDLKSIKVKFEKGKPFQPYEQLMSVLPADSGHTLPAVFRPLMSDPDSPIIDFYPQEFPLDMNGKKMAWQAIVLLPFIEEERLLKHVRAKYDELTDEELERNEHKKEVLYISSQNNNADRFKEIYTLEKVKIDFKFDKNGLAGKIEPNENYSLDGTVVSPISHSDVYGSISNSQFLKFDYTMPLATQSKSILLTGYVKHLSVLTQEDKDAIIYNSRPNYRNQNVNNNFIKFGPHGDQHFSLREYSFKATLSQLISQQQAAQQQHNFQKNFHVMKNENQYNLPQPNRQSASLPKPSGGGFLRR
ncbi:hypothetical protein WICMUC_004666 [Wickerhamomyces mucosus]|uniref:5'-3' exoribonuclease n=1 Tax=Wickerhamomyces mucosus TaxID=1378264 RepID=A0A9P8PHJ5_9ASCO|nr:hypothetical protein WICMUC_004666 [Wickerhamomyces mucosus]